MTDWYERSTLPRYKNPPVVEAALAHKKEVKRRLATPSTFGDDPPPGELRAVKVIPNKAALRDGFTIPTNMRVPAASVIYCGAKFGQCKFSMKEAPGEGLPVMVVDEEIYRRLPSLLITTVDKFAQMPWNGSVQMLFGQVDGYCERKGRMRTVFQVVIAVSLSIMAVKGLMELFRKHPDDHRPHEREEHGR